MPSLSPDGTQVAYRSSDIGSNDAILHVLAIETGARIRLTDTAGPHGLPRWSPDGKWVAFRTDGLGLFIVSPLGGKARKVLEAAAGQRLLLDAGRPPHSVCVGSAARPGSRRWTSGAGKRGWSPSFLTIGWMPYGSAIAVSADGALIATGETDPAVPRHPHRDPPTGRQSRTDQTAVRFGPGGDFLGIQFLPGATGTALRRCSRPLMPCACIAVRSTAPASSVCPTWTTTAPSRR